MGWKMAMASTNRAIFYTPFNKLKIKNLSILIIKLDFNLKLIYNYNHINLQGNKNVYNTP